MLHAAHPGSETPCGLAPSPLSVRNLDRQSMVRSAVTGWVLLACTDGAMKIWPLRVIEAENVTVRREGQVLWFPPGPDVRLDRGIEKVITVVAKLAHYWQDQIASKVGSCR